MSSAAPVTLKAILSTRLDAQALDNLEQLSDGQTDFIVFMVSKLHALLLTVSPRLSELWESKDYRAMALEVHKLRSSVAYVGAKKLDRLVNEAEPLLRTCTGDTADPATGRALGVALETMMEARGLLDWLNLVMPKSEAA